MSTKIAKVEDIVSVVGMRNYIEALDLEKEKLQYLGDELKKGEIKLN